MEAEKSIESIVKSNVLKLVGLKQVLRGIKEGRVMCVVLALDSDEEIRTVIKHETEKHAIELKTTHSKSLLGKWAGIEVDCAVVGLVA